MRHALLTAAVFLAAPAFADTTVTPEMFERLTEGKTYYYGVDGKPYGAEEYKPGRRVTWTFLDGKCLDGQWFADLDLICFVYENNLEPQCWSFHLQDGGLVAQFENLPGATTLYEMRQSNEPLRCPGPEVGA